MITQNLCFVFISSGRITSTVELSKSKEEEIRSVGSTDTRKKSPKKKVPSKGIVPYDVDHVTMKSEVLSPALTDELLTMSKIFIKTLLLSKFNTSQGINISADIPRCCNHPVINIKRPAVLRIYYGKTDYCVNSPYVERPTYGPTRLYSSVGIDPYQYHTKPFTTELTAISKYLKKFIQGYHFTFLEKKVTHDFNHCTVLVYRSNDSKSNSSLSYHCDSTYDTNGNFIQKSNTQMQNSIVLVLSLGDPRELKYALRFSYGNKWVMSNVSIPSTTLEHNCLYILHCEDEIPTNRNGSIHLSQIMHGGVSMIGTNELSIALCFRMVTKKRKYNPVTNLLITEDTDLSGPDHHDATSNSLRSFKASEQEKIQLSFSSFVVEKFQSWGWFTPKEIQNYLD